MDKDYFASVFVGRFQPFHNSHLEIARYGLKIAKKLVIVVGSCNAAPSTKNPFTFEERKQMIMSCFSDGETHDETGEPRLHVVGVRDYFSSDNAWVTDVQQKTSEFFGSSDTVALLGNYKDDTSYYLKMFPQWEFVPTRTSMSMNATDIRARLLGDVPEPWGVDLPDAVVCFITHDFIGSPRFLQLCREFEQNEKYRAQWKDAPFPPTFVTVDAVVVKSGHVLLVRRKFEPGKGLLALPGGFLRTTERIEDGMLRELKEETGIRVPQTILRSSIKESRVFDYPGRSLRGRTITHAFYIRLENGMDLPEVRGNDDASRALWLPLMDVAKRENEFFEDHAQIVWAFVNK